MLVDALVSCFASKASVFRERGAEERNTDDLDSQASLLIAPWLALTRYTYFDDSTTLSELQISVLILSGVFAMKSVAEARKHDGSSEVFLEQSLEHSREEFLNPKLEV